MDVTFSRHHEMIPDEDGNLHEHLFVRALAITDRMPYFYILDAGRSEIEEDPIFSVKIEQLEKLAEMGLRRYVDEHPVATLTARD